MKYYEEYENIYLEKYLKGDFLRPKGTHLQTLFEEASAHFSALNSSLQILEWGCGLSSIFENIFHPNNYFITAIDISQTAIDLAKRFSQNETISYLQADLLDWGRFSYYDFIIDGHALGRMGVEEDFIMAVQGAYHSLSTDGVFAFELGVGHDELSLSDSYLLVDQTFFLHRKNQRPFPAHFLPRALWLEDLLKKLGFEIIYFKVFDDQYFIFDETVETRFNPRLLRAVCKKRIS